MRVITVVVDQQTLSGLQICDKPGDWDPRTNRTGPFPKSLGRGRYGAERYRHMEAALPRSLWPHWFSWPGELPRGGDTCTRLLKGKFTKERQTRTFPAADSTCRGRAARGVLPGVQRLGREQAAKVSISEHELCPESCTCAWGEAPKRFNEECCRQLSASG